MDLQYLETTSIDNSVIKKAKARLYAEIELSDEGAVDYKGILITKEDCEKAIDQLEDRLFLEYYYHLASNQLLNNFLISTNWVFRLSISFCCLISSLSIIGGKS